MSTAAGFSSWPDSATSGGPCFRSCASIHTEAARASNCADGRDAGAGSALRVTGCVFLARGRDPRARLLPLPREAPRLPMTCCKRRSRSPHPTSLRRTALERSRADTSRRLLPRARGRVEGLEGRQGLRECGARPESSRDARQIARQIAFAAATHGGLRKRLLGWVQRLVGRRRSASRKVASSISSASESSKSQSWSASMPSSSCTWPWS